MTIRELYEAKTQLAQSLKAVFGDYDVYFSILYTLLQNNSSFMETSRSLDDLETRFFNHRIGWEDSNIDTIINPGRNSFIYTGDTFKLKFDLQVF